MTNEELLKRLESWIATVRGELMTPPAPTPVPTPIPTPSPLPDLPVRIAKLTRVEDADWKGGNSLDPFYLLKTDGPKTIFLPTEKAWRIKPIHTTVPSYEGARVGDWMDICEPATEILPGEVYVVINTKMPPHSNNYPVLMELCGQWVTSVHGNKEGKLEPQVAHTKSYRELIQSFGITTGKDWVTASVTDPVFITSDFSKPTRMPIDINSSVDQIKASAKAVEDLGIKYPFSYLVDEPATSVFPKIITQAKLIKQYAPSIKIMVTTEWSAGLAPYVDIFCPVMDYFNNAIPDGKYHPQRSSYDKSFWLYTSNMAHGGNGIGKSSGVPDLVIDRGAKWARYAVVTAWALGAEAFLYYNTVEAYRTGDPIKNINIFGGNGDGTLVYPGPNGTALPSLRLFFLLQGLYDIDTLISQGYKPGFLDKATQWHNLIPLVEG